MRLIATKRVIEGTELGADVMTGRADGIPLLRSGAQITGRYKEALLKAGVHAVYIRDELSEGIEPHQLVSDETRSAATKAVSEAFEGARDAIGAGRPLGPEALNSLEDIVDRLLKEVWESGEVAVALQDLSSADAYTLQHSIDVAALGLLIGQRLFRERGWVDYRGRRSWAKIDTRLSRLGMGLLVHDIGKLIVPTEILNKPGELDEAEWALMRTHPQAGLQMLRSDLISPLVKAVVRWHHERWDGSGYPEGKAGEDIHELARICAVADVYDAVTSERVYASAKPSHVGVKVILDGAGKHFDPEVVNVFSKLVAPYPPGVEITLEDGRSGIVVSVPPNAVDRPLVRITDGRGAPYEVALEDDPGICIRGWEAPAPSVRARSIAQ